MASVEWFQNWTQSTHFHGNSKRLERSHQWLSMGRKIKPLCRKIAATFGQDVSIIQQKYIILALCEIFDSRWSMSTAYLHIFRPFSSSSPPDEMQQPLRQWWNQSSRGRTNVASCISSPESCVQMIHPRYLHTTTCVLLCTVKTLLTLKRSLW